MIQLAGNSHARKFTAAIAIPTPKRTPANTRFEPPSPKAKVRPATTMATRDRPRAIVLVKACCNTLTAFSQGEAPAWAKPGAARSNVVNEARSTRVEPQPRTRFQSFFISHLNDEVALRGAMRGKFVLLMRAAGRSRNALVRRHARLTPGKHRPLRHAATQQQSGFSRELPSI